MFSGIRSVKVMCSSVSSQENSPSEKAIFPSRTRAAFSSLPLLFSMNAFTFGPSRPNCLPIAFMVGTAVHSNLSQTPLTAETARAFARSHAISFMAATASRTSSDSVATTTSKTGQRPFLLPFWRAFATASSKDWISSISFSRTASRSSSRPANQSCM